MALINLTNISVSFGSAPLLEKINFSITEGERVCIIGRNGMGKSTLLKIINRNLLADEGEIISSTGLRVARLEQDVPQDIEGTVLDVVTAGLGEEGKLLATYQKLTKQMTQHPSDNLFKQLEDTQHLLDEHQAWDLSPKIDQIIEKMGLPAEMSFSELSGGLKRRVLLGKALVTEPNLLLLDEPTNHLDIEAIGWLENLLRGFAGAVIFITHDRMFMQQVATRIVEIDRGKLSNYPGNYQAYVDRKQHELEVEEIHNRNFDKKLAQEEVWIRQGIKARRTRNEGRVRALEKLRQQRSQRREVMGKVQMQAQQAESSGKIVIEAKDISLDYKHKPLIRDFSTTIMRGDKIGLIGPNGVGKTTLLKILLGELVPDQGSVKQGTKLEIAYFDQLRSQLDEDQSVADNVGYGDQFVTINGKAVHIIGYLQDFLFSPERARTPVRALSGGERNRLLLARLFSKPSNVLVLDEPTNDLDLETLELLEELISQYEGTVLLVSHDRSFLDNIVTGTIVFEGLGKLGEYVGGYNDWLRQKPKTPSKIEKTSSAITPVSAPTKPTANFRQQKEIKALEQKIEKQEKKRVELEAAMADPQLYEVKNQDKLKKLQQELAQLSAEIKELYAQWEHLL